MKTDKTGKYFSQAIIVREGHLDSLHHVNNQIYLQWANDIAKSHWFFLTSGAYDQRYFWVIRRHEIDYLKPAILNDQLQIITWVGETEGVWSVRHVQIRKGDELLVDVKTTWILIDSEKMRPVRITEEIIQALRGNM